MSERGTTNGNVRGNTTERARRRQWLLDTFGDGVTAMCAFECGTELTIETITVDRYPIPGCQGGTYAKENIRPACAADNSRHGGGLRSTKTSTVPE